MTHGWPELSISWRHQLSYLGGLGYRAIAPDMRGYGGSSLYTEHEAYVQREIVQDMVELIDSIGREQAVWIGHDWGSPVAWNVALHHPERRCCGKPLRTLRFFRSSERSGIRDQSGVVSNGRIPCRPMGLPAFLLREFRGGAKRNGAGSRANCEIIVRKGDPNGQGQIAGTAVTRKNGGWFTALGGVPDSLPDYDVVTDQDIAIYTKHLIENGFFGPNSGMSMATPIKATLTKKPIGDY